VCVCRFVSGCICQAALVEDWAGLSSWYWSRCRFISQRSRRFVDILPAAVASSFVKITQETSCFYVYVQVLVGSSICCLSYIMPWVYFQLLRPFCVSETVQPQRVVMICALQRASEICTGIQKYWRICSMISIWRLQPVRDYFKQSNCLLSVLVLSVNRYANF